MSSNNISRRKLLQVATAGLVAGLATPLLSSRALAAEKRKVLIAYYSRTGTTREVADARTYGITGFARDVLEIADNLQRALDAVPAEARAAADPGLKSLMEGVELTERSLLNALEKNGVKKFDPAGQKFDPNFQQAMFEVPDPSVPSGTVVQVVQAGYMIGDRVLRPALVGVAKGGAKPAAAASEQSN